MTVDFAFICEGVDFSDGFTATKIGGDHVWSSEFPVLHPGFHLACRFRNTGFEAGVRDVRIILMDPDGEILMVCDQELDLVAPRGAGKIESTTRWVVCIQDVPLEAPGPHSLHVLVDSVEVVRLPVSVGSGPPDRKN